MQVALIDNQLTIAEANAPKTATCPGCGGIVTLRSRQGKYFWRHQRVPPGGCSAKRDQHPSSDESKALDAIARKCGGTVFGLRAGETLTLTGPGIVVLIAPTKETD